MDLPVLLIASIPILVGVIAGVQAAKVFGFVNSENAGRAALIIALVLGLLAAAQELFPEAKPYIELAYITYLGVVGAGLGYEYALKPAAERLGLRVLPRPLGA